MPELPELQAHAERLTEALRGDVLRRVEALSFSALKTYDPPVDAAVGSSVVGVARRGKHLLVGFEGDVVHVVHLMQGGRLKPDPKQARRPKGGLVRWVFADGGAYLLTEAGTEHRAGVWTVRGDPLDQPPLDDLGPEADVLASDPPALLQRLRAKPARLHTALRDQQVLAGVGRRLANEVCFRARLSPFAPTAKLTDDEGARVAAALADALEESLAEERGRTDMSSSRQRTSLVHNRAGEPCTVCGDVVRAVEYRTYTVSYCARCQTGGKVLADNTTSKFLK